MPADAASRPIGVGLINARAATRLCCGLQKKPATVSGQRKGLDQGTFWAVTGLKEHYALADGACEPTFYWASTSPWGWGPQRL